MHYLQKSGFVSIFGWKKNQGNYFYFFRASGGCRKPGELHSSLQRSFFAPLEAVFPPEEVSASWLKHGGDQNI